MKRRGFLALLGGATLLRPVSAHPQQPPRVYRIAGVMPSYSPYFLNEALSPRYWRPFFDELRREGFAEGRNLTVERHFGHGRSDEFAELAHRVAASKPDAILCSSDRLAAHLNEATATIPIVAIASDPVAFGLVRSLARPGGNLTGVAPDGGLAFYAKHLELLRLVAPTASRVAYLTPRAVWESPILLEPVRQGARQAGVTLLPAVLDPPAEAAEYRRAFAAIAQARADALIVGESAENYTQGRLVIELAALGRLPAVYPGRYFAESGGLLSYGADYPHLYRRAGAQIATILNGANPGDIPVYQASRFELVINLKTANALGLTVPRSLLARADAVIE